MSDYNDILTAVQSLLTPVVTNTVIRKKMQILDQDTLPICIICTGRGGQEISKLLFSKTVFYTYPVTVMYYAAGNKTLTSPSSFLTVTEQIKRALSINKLSITRSFNLETFPMEEYELEDYKLTNYDAAGWRLEQTQFDTRT